MEIKCLFIVLSLFAVSTEIVSATTNKVICYYGSWAHYRLGNGRFTVDDIDTSLCTHAIYSFIGINADGSIKILDTWLELHLGNLKKFTTLKDKNPNIKLLVAIGGWNEGSLVFSNVAASQTKRAKLIKSALQFVQTYGLDGFDLDWEYPGQRGGAHADIQNFATLLKEFREEWDKHGLLLTAAVAASGPSVDLSYDVPSLSKYLDLINVMAYDFHGAYDGVTGQNAPLYPSANNPNDPLTVDGAIRGWIQRGADPQKIALGLGIYGRTYTLSTSANSLGAPVSNGGYPGAYTQEVGMLGYHEICERLSEGGWVEVWDDEQKVPYAFKDNQWIGFDNPKSIALKVEYAKSLNLGAVMIWSIETEDFRGNCGTKYPILNTIKASLESSDETLPPSDSDNNDNTDIGDNDETDNNDSENNDTDNGNTDNNESDDKENETTKKPTTTTTTTTEPPSNNDNSSSSKICKKVGYVRDPTNCKVFYYCLPVHNDFVPLKHECHPGLAFDEVAVSCNWQHLVKC